MTPTDQDKSQINDFAHSSYKVIITQVSSGH